MHILYLLVIDKLILPSFGLMYEHAYMTRSAITGLNITGIHGDQLSHLGPQYNVV